MSVLRQTKMQVSVRVNHLCNYFLFAGVFFQGRSTVDHSLCVCVSVHLCFCLVIQSNK